MVQLGRIPCEIAAFRVVLGSIKGLTSGKTLLGKMVSSSLMVASGVVALIAIGEYSQVF